MDLRAELDAELRNEVPPGETISLKVRVTGPAYTLGMTHFRAFTGAARSGLFVPLLLSLSLIMPVTAVPVAGATGRYSLVLWAFRPTNPASSTLYAGETARVDAVGYFNGNVPRQGTVTVSSNDPANRSICVISLSGHRYYCDTVFATPGRWLLSAVFRQVVRDRSVIRARKNTAIDVQPAPVPAQFTEMLFDSAMSYYWTAPGGGYDVQLAGLLTVMQTYSNQLTSPGAGTISFTDATGATLCQVSVPQTPVAQVLQCTGGPFSSAPSGFITASYSGTSIGIDDGNGVVYAPDTSAPAQIAFYP